MFLDQTTRKLQVVLTTAATSLNMPIVVDYVDISNVATTPGLYTANTNGVTVVDFLLAPAAGVVRKVNGIQIYNRDTAAKIVQVYLNDNGTQVQLTDVTLAVDDVLGYTDTRGWYVMDGQGNQKTTSTISGIISTSKVTGIGYGTGAGAAVTQITSRSTGVTINAVTGTIQTDVTSLAAGASAIFTVTNSSVAIGDVVVVSQRSGSSNAAGVAGTTFVNVVAVAAGSFNIAIDNKSTTTAETGAIIINFAVIKAVSA